FNAVISAVNTAICTSGEPVSASCVRYSLINSFLRSCEIDIVNFLLFIFMRLYPSKTSASRTATIKVPSMCVHHIRLKYYMLFRHQNQQKVNISLFLYLYSFVQPKDLYHQI